MEENKHAQKDGVLRLLSPVLIALIVAATAIACTTIFINGITNYRKAGGGSGLTATGSASYDFESFQSTGRHRAMPTV